MYLTSKTVLDNNKSSNQFLYQSCVKRLQVVLISEIVPAFKICKTQNDNSFPLQIILTSLTSQYKTLA